MVGILKEYRFYLLCSWNHILAFNVELYSLFKLQILETVVILQGLFFFGGGVPFLAASCGMWDLCSPTRDQTRAPCIGSTES